MNNMIIVSIVVVLLLILCWIFGFWFLSNKRDDRLDIFRKYAYFDYNGTTPPYPSVLRVMTDTSNLGNVSSKYADVGKDILKKAEALICTAVGNPDAKVIFTSGASESNNLFLRGITDYYWLKKSEVDTHLVELPHIIISAIEHKTSIDCAKQLADLKRAEITFIEPRIDGRIDPMEIAYAIRPNTIGISVMHSNNETGAINDIPEINKIAKSRGIVFHTDAAQTFGKIDCPRIDAISISFHKICGPTGVGALVISSNTNLVPQICGSQNSGLRGGTYDIAGIAGAMEAAKLSISGIVDMKTKLLSIKISIIDFLNKTYNLQKYSEYAGKPERYDPFEIVERVREKCNIVFLGPTYFSGIPDLEKSMNNTILVSFVRHAPLKNHFCNIALVEALQKDGVIISVGSACNADKSVSHVLKSMKAPFIIRCGVVRISFGCQTTQSDVRKLCTSLKKNAI